MTINLPALSSCPAYLPFSLSFSLSLSLAITRILTISPSSPSASPFLLFLSTLYPYEYSHDEGAIWKILTVHQFGNTLTRRDLDPSSPRSINHPPPRTHLALDTALSLSPLQQKCFTSMYIYLSILLIILLSCLALALALTFTFTFTPALLLSLS